MEKTFDVEKAIQAQQEHCKKYAASHPQDLFASSMKKGIGFAPADGFCYNCRQQIYSAEGFSGVGRRKEEGISVEKARSEFITGCPFCHRSYVD